jgi:trk system potassium uptake protein TrkH
LFFGFGALILIGGGLLALPFATNAEGGAPLVTAMFTSTSAVTVTGQTVVDTSTYWSFSGQAIIFGLMLVGGLGFMTVATFLLIVIGQRISLSERILMSNAIGVDRIGSLVRVTRNIIIMVVMIYALGILLLWWQLADFFSTQEALWQAAFHTVSSFNNAGFSIIPATVHQKGFAGNMLLLSFMTGLIILGGIGWTTLVDIWKNHRFSRWSLDTRMVVVTSLFLWSMGAVVFYIAEFNNEETIGNFSVIERVFYSVFHSISGRTAGFVTIDFSRASELTLLFYPFLMFIGGAAGSVAGGIKVATFAVIIAAVVSSIRGRPQAEAFRRAIPPFQVHRAVAIAVLAIAFIFFATLILTLTEDLENFTFLNLLFDSVSAFGTTGLSTGVPSELSVGGKAIFMLLMFVGRLGPLTMALAIAPLEDSTVYRFAEERVKIG